MTGFVDYPEDFTTITIPFTTHQANGALVGPLSALEAADVKIFKNGSETEKTTTNGLTMTSSFNGTTGSHMLVIDSSNDTGDGGFWVAGAVYDVFLEPDETVDGIAVGKWIGKFGLALANVLRPTTPGRTLAVDATGIADANLAEILGDAQSATDLKGFADAGYDPATNKVQGVVLVDTVTTYTGNTPQTGDAYAVVNHVTHGNAALKTLIDVIDGIVDAILVDTDATIPGLINSLNDVTANEVRDAVFARAFSAAYGGFTFDEITKLMAAALLAKVSGMDLNSPAFRNLIDTANTIVATTDASGNRTAVTLTP